ncbi:hypothetical protein SD81_012960 [Tolypothrix campylonemoides VB511288]|nr:hypothetical protein SD81_012960 [Tolypothrix campylonemoides VB511288]
MSRGKEAQVYFNLILKLLTTEVEEVLQKPQVIFFQAQCLNLFQSGAIVFCVGSDRAVMVLDVAQ